MLPARSPEENKRRERKCSRRVLFRVDAIHRFGAGRRESAQVCGPAAAYSFTTSACLSIIWPVKRSMAT